MRDSDISRSVVDTPPPADTEARPASASLPNAASVQRWRIFWALGAANLIGAMDTVFSSVALPTIAEDFGMSLSSAAWIPLAGALTISALLLPMGRLADLTGRKRMQLAGIAMLCGGSVLAAAAPSVPVLIAARMVSSAGVAIVFTQMLSIVAVVFPDNERSRALGAAMAVTAVGMMIGPVVGGAVVALGGWRAAYAVMAVIAVPGLVASQVVLEESRIGPAERLGGTKFDWQGALLIACGICLAIVTLNEGNRVGWLSPAILGMAASSGACMALFVWWERRREHPLFDLSYFGNRVFASAITARCLGFLGGSTTFFLLPFMVQDVQGHSASAVGLVFSSASVAAVLSATLLGRMFDRNRVRFATLGLALGMTSNAMFALFWIEAPLALVCLANFVAGLGFGVWITPVSAITLSSIDNSSYGPAAAFMNVVRNTSQVAAVAAATAIVTGVMLSRGASGDLGDISSDPTGTAGEAFVAGSRIAFIAASAVTAAAMVVIASLRGRGEVTASDEPQSAK